MTRRRHNPTPLSRVEQKYLSHTVDPDHYTYAFNTLARDEDYRVDYEEPLESHGYPTSQAELVFLAQDTADHVDWLDKKVHALTVEQRKNTALTLKAALELVLHELQQRIPWAFHVGDRVTESNPATPPAPVSEELASVDHVVQRFRNWDIES